MSEKVVAPYGKLSKLDTSICNGMKLQPPFFLLPLVNLCPARTRASLGVGGCLVVCDEWVIGSRLCNQSRLLRKGCLGVSDQTQGSGLTLGHWIPTEDG